MDDGGYDVNFIEDVADYLKCIICQMVLKNPVLFVECGHKFCYCCFDKMKKHACQKNIDLLCPTDRMKVDFNKVVEDKGISRVILDLHIKCDNYLDGCQWTGELRNLEKHLHRDCTVNEKEKTSARLIHIEKRLGKCEQRLEEKEKELTMLKEQWKHSEDNLYGQITSLKKEFVEYINQSSGRYAAEANSAPCEESLGKLSLLVADNSTATNKINELENIISNPCNQSKDEILVKEQISLINEQIKLLSKRVTSIIATLDLDDDNDYPDNPPTPDDFPDDDDNDGWGNDDYDDGDDYDGNDEWEENYEDNDYYGGGYDDGGYDDGGGGFDDDPY